MITPSYSLAAAALVLGAVIGGAGMWHLATLKAKAAEAERLRRTLLVVEAAQAETIRLQEVKDAALEAANQRARANAAAAAAVRTERDGLRNDLADARSRLPALPHQACIDRAAALDAVLDQCAGTVEGLARAADAHASDARTLNEAWP